MTDERLAAIEKELAEIKERLDAQSNIDSSERSIVLSKKFIDIFGTDNGALLIMIQLLLNKDKDNTVCCSVRNLSRTTNTEYNRTRKILEEIEVSGFIKNITEDSHTSKFIIL